MRFALLLLLPFSMIACTDEGLAPPVGGEGGIAAGDGGARGDGPLASADLSGMIDPDGGTNPLPDGASSAVDLSVRPDLAGAAQTIACGQAMSCDVPVLACCTATYGITGTCGAANAGCANGQALKFLCDGDEDCKNNEVCCYHPQAGSLCEKNCTALGTREMCHVDQTCGVAKCCSLGLNTPYSACMIGICPF